MADFDGRCSHRFQDIFHLRHRVGAADRCRPVMARETASVQKPSRIGQDEMEAVTNQITDHYRMAGHAQRLGGKLCDLLRSEMVREERAANYIEAIIAERQSQ